MQAPLEPLPFKKHTLPLTKDFEIFLTLRKILFFPQNPQKIRPTSPRGGTRDFKWRGWSNGAKSQDSKKALRLPAKHKKIPGPKINPQKIPGRFCAL